MKFWLTVTIGGDSETYGFEFIEAAVAVAKVYAREAYNSGDPSEFSLQFNCTWDEDDEPMRYKGDDNNA